MPTRLLLWLFAIVLPTLDETSAPPDRSTALPGLDQLDVSADLRRLQQEAVWPLKLGLYGSALAFICAPVLTIGWPLPIFFLPRAARDRHAHAMANHRFYLLRQAMLMLKTVAGALWGAHPAVRNRLGLTPYGNDPGTFRGDHQVDVDLGVGVER